MACITSLHRPHDSNLLQGGLGNLDGPHRPGELAQTLSVISPPLGALEP